MLVDVSKDASIPYLGRLNSLLVDFAHFIPKLPLVAAPSVLRYQLLGLFLDFWLVERWQSSGVFSNIAIGNLLVNQTGEQTQIVRIYIALLLGTARIG